MCKALRIRRNPPRLERASHMRVEDPAGGKWLSLSEVPRGGAESGSLSRIGRRGYLGVASGSDIWLEPEPLKKIATKAIFFEVSLGETSGEKFTSRDRAPSDTRVSD